MVATEQAVVASGGQADPGLASVQAEVTAKQTAYDQALSSYQNLLAKAQSELNGAYGTGTAGTGEAYVQGKAAADVQTAVAAGAKADLDAAVSAASSAAARSARQASGDVVTDQAELTRLT